MTLRAGDTVGRYRIVAQLGQGGMATVYKAFQPSLQREIALKVLRPGFSHDPEFRERFEREAIAIARLRHPHIVQVFDFEAGVDGEYVLAMELLEGGTLMDRLVSLHATGKRVERREAVRIVTEVAEALAYAHEQGVVHRDVKPSNVMLTRNGWAVVTDFGIARILEKTAYTRTGVGMGTPAYMAPEQGLGQHVDRRADIYSLGVMAFEMLTGRLPFSGDSAMAVALAHIREPLPRPSDVEPSIGPAMERAIIRALAKDPADRPDSATDFADALRAALAEDGAAAERPTVGRVWLGTRPGPVRAGLVAVLLVIGSGAVGSVFRAVTDPGTASATRPPPTVSPTARAPAAAVAVTLPPATARVTPTIVPSTAAPAAIATPTLTPRPAATPALAVAPTPAPTPQPTPKPTAAPTPSAYVLGQTAVLRWSLDVPGEIEVTLLDVVDPASVSEDYEAAPGARWVAFRVLIKNRGPAVYDEYPPELAEVMDGQGRLYGADPDEPVAPGFGQLRLAPGGSGEGWISVELDEAVDARAFLFSASFFEGDTARWNVP